MGAFKNTSRAAVSICAFQLCRRNSARASCCACWIAARQSGSRSARDARLHLRLPARDDPAAERHFHRHRADRLRKDDDALLLSAQDQHDRFQAAHRGGAGGIRSRRDRAGAGERSDRADLCARSARTFCGRIRTASWWAKRATWRRRRLPSKHR